MTRPLAVVTGASRRVGAATALELARNGFDLLLTWRAISGDRASREMAKAEIEATAARSRAAAAAAGHDPRIELVEADLGDPASLESLCNVLRCMESIDALIHNAASYSRDREAPSVEAAALHHFRVNALAPLAITSAAADALRRSQRASVVLFSDIHVLGRPRRGYTAYLMSKAAATQMVESLARELAPAIRVNAIAPGVVAWPDDAPLDERRAYEARIPLARSGTAEEAAEVVRWLVMEASYVTGQVLRVDGGRWLC